MDTDNLTLLLISVRWLPVLFLYAGPDQLLPLVSFLGGLIGIFLIGWQRLVMFVRKAFRFVTAKFQPSRK